MQFIVLFKVKFFNINGLHFINLAIGIVMVIVTDMALLDFFGLDQILNTKNLFQGSKKL